MKHILFIFCVSIWLAGYGQNPNDFEKEKVTDIDSSILKSQYYLNKNLDSALYFARLAESELIENKIEGSVPLYLSFAEAYRIKGDMDQSLDYYLRAKKLIDKALEENPQNAELQMQNAELFLGVGILKFNLHQYDQSLLEYESALTTLEAIQDKIPEQEMARKKAGVYNNIAGVYIQKGDYNTALAYFQNALKLNEIVKDPHYESSLTNNIGICYREKKEYDLADHYFLKSLTIRTNSNDKRGQAQCLNNLAKNQIYQGNFPQAREYYENALSLGEEIGNAQSMLISLESLSSVYDTLGNYKKALSTFKDFKQLNDSIFNIESAANIATLEADYRQEKEEKVAELEKERNKAELQKAQTKNIAFFGALFFLLLTAVLLLILMRSRVIRSKLEQEKLNLESQNHELERRTLVETLEYKERELTANALFLLKNNELLSNITEKLLKAKATFKQENQKIIQDIIFELKANQNENVWDEFEAHFTRVHADFYQELQKEFPNLTSNEMKLCAFLRLNMSTKEISAITYQSVNSITVARSRLRKKLNIDGEDTQLVNFLMKF